MLIRCTREDDEDELSIRKIQIDEYEKKVELTRDLEEITVIEI